MVTPNCGIVPRLESNGLGDSTSTANEETAVNSVRHLRYSLFAILLVAGLLSAQGRTAQDQQTSKLGAASGKELASQSFQNTSYMNQRLSVSLRNVTIAEALEQIREQTHIEFTYSDDLLPSGRVTLLRENITVAKALDALLEGTNMSWLAMSGGTVILLTKARLQQEIGVVSGFVKDERTGEALVGANVTIDGTTLGAATDENGEFNIERVGPGTHTVIAKFIGYKSSSQTFKVSAGAEARVEVQIGQRTEVNFTLRSAELVIGGVEVVATRPIEVERTNVSTIVREMQIEALPLSSRNFVDLAALAPGVRSFPGAPPSYGAFNQYRFLNVYVDGAEWKNRFNSNTMGNVQSGVVPQSAIQEFRFLNNAYDAEYGRGGAFIITAITKRGSNDLHVNAFYKHRNKEWNALGAFQKAKPDFRFGVMGASVSGPILENKLFYAATYERNDLTSIIQTSPGKPSYNPNMFAAYAKAEDAPSVDNLWALRLTAQLWEDHISEIVWHGRRSQLESTWGGLRPKQGGIVNDQLVDNILVKDTWTISGNSLNEFTFQFIRWNVNPKPLTYEPEYRYPSIILGGSGAFPRNLTERAFRIKDNFSFVTRDWGGEHNFSAGFEVTYHTVDVNHHEYERPLFFFRTDTSAMPYQAQMSIGKNDPFGISDAHAISNAKFFSIYFKDKWRPLPQLTIDVGIRWDGDIDALNNDFVSPLANDTTITNNIDSKYINRGDRKNNLFDIAPRIGFSWDLFGTNQTTIRGGFGLFYDRVAYVYPYYEKRDIAWVSYTINNPGTKDPNVLRQKILSGDGTAKPNITLMDKTMKDPVTREFSIGISHYLSDDLVLNADYVNNSGSDYYSRYVENYYKPSKAKRTITEKFGDMYIWGNFGENFYQALLLGLEKPYSEGWALQVSYALSETRGEVEAPESGYTFLSSFKDAFSSMDERHRLTVNGMVDLPFGFRIAGIVSVASPTPIAATVGMDLNDNNNFADDWPNNERNSVRPDANKITNWYKNIDLRIIKNFPTQYGNLELTAEAFNVFNWRNNSAYGSRMSDAKGSALVNFGLPTAAYLARQIQLGVKYSY